MESTEKRAVRLFTLVIALTALANGLGSSIFSNYFNEVYHIDSIQRGFIEIPGRAPGTVHGTGGGAGISGQPVDVGSGAAAAVDRFGCHGSV